MSINIDKYFNSPIEGKYDKFNGYTNNTGLYSSGLEPYNQEKRYYEKTYAKYLGEPLVLDFFEFVRLSQFASLLEKKVLSYYHKKLVEEETKDGNISFDLHVLQRSFVLFRRFFHDVGIDLEKKK